MSPTPSPSPQSTPELAGPQHKLPAWALSVVVHIVLMLLLGLFVRTAPRGISQSPERGVSLVLASTSSAGETEYLDEGPDDVTDSDHANPVREMAEPATAALPPQSEPPSLALAELQLPGPAEATGPAADGLVQSPSLVVSGRKPLFPGQVDHEAVAAEQARLRGRFPSGPTAEVSLFGSAPAVGRSFIFVIDRSHSMGGEGLGVLAEAEKELSRALANLQAVHKFQIIAYHHKPVYFSDDGLVPATPENQRRVSKFFGGLAAFGSTRHDMALLAALRAEPDVVFLLTDGGDPAPNPAAMNEIRKRAGGRTTIHCLQFGYGVLQERDNFMQRLASETGGSFGYVQVGAR